MRETEKHWGRERVPYTHQAQAKLARLKQREKMTPVIQDIFFEARNFLKLQGIGRDVHYKTTKLPF